MAAAKKIASLKYDSDNIKTLQFPENSSPPSA